jgi:glutamate racemase
MTEPARNRAPIGVFDSGIGGLTVARAIYERLPHESTIYFGDTARVPYGPKSPETVRRYSLEILHWLLGQGVKAVVIACNAYARAIHAIAPAARVEQLACPLFVPLVEEGWFDRPATGLIADEYLEPLRRAGIDTLVLGCTHYPLLKPLLQRVMGPGVTLIDSAQETAGELARVLDSRHLATPDARPAVHRFAVSDDEARFRQVGTRFIGERLDSAEVVPMG